MAALPQAVLFAAKEPYMTREQIAQLAKDLVDLLVTV